MEKHKFLTCFGAFILIMILSFASANTIIAGKIYNSDYTSVISDAYVEVTCHENVLKTTSLADGSYKVEYNGSAETGSCGIEDTLVVYAEKGSLYGSKTGVIKAEGECTNPANENCLISVYSGLDVAVVNVPLVPEFGLIVGGLTILSALTAFFFVRRK